MQTDYSIGELLLSNSVIDIARDLEEGIIAIVAGDGIDFKMFLYEGDKILTSNECGETCGIPYTSAQEYLDSFNAMDDADEKFSESDCSEFSKFLEEIDAL